MTHYDWNRPPLGMVDLLDATLCELAPSLDEAELHEWLTLVESLGCVAELPAACLGGPQLPAGTLSLAARPELLEAAAAWPGREVLLWPQCPLEEGEEPLEQLLQACNLARSRDLRPTPVVERAGQMHPVRLARVLRTIVEAGCAGLMLDDRAGAVSSAGVGHLVRFVTGLSGDYGRSLEVTWSAAHSEGMALAHALEALENGATRVRAVALGGVGIPLELMLVNLVLEGRRLGPPQALSSYCQWAERCLGRVLPMSYPVFGGDAFRISSERMAQVCSQPGALQREETLASGVPASWFGARLRLELGRDSGPRLAERWLRERELPYGAEQIRAALELSQGDHLPNDLEVFEALRGAGT